MKGEYYIPRTQTTWEIEDDRILDEVSLLDAIKYAEGIKRIPHTWIIRLEKNGVMIEVNRRAIARLRAEQLKKRGPVED
jgi:hypothetical protein